MSEVRVIQARDGTLVEGDMQSLASMKGRGMLWVDLFEPDAGSVDAIGDVFGIHPLAREDVLHFPQRPKIDIYPGYLFLVWLVPDERPHDGIGSREVDVFMGQDFILTVHAESSAEIETVFTRDALDTLDRGPEWTVHAILDRFVDCLFPMTDSLGDDIDAVEDRMMVASKRTDLERLYALKRDFRDLHRIISAERDVLRALARQEALTSSEAWMYFQDIEDHLARVQESLDSDREVASGAMDIYLSSVSNRLNIIMKRLTIVATIFMPLTLISSIYGMNFRHMPELYWRFGYAGVLSGMGLIVIGMLVYFKKQDWW